jgi:pimeloyl-ACP methyl ester carboxylesterase
MPYFTMRDGAKIFAWVMGKGEPCILLHGFVGDARIWLPFVAPLLHRHRFILPDLRGFGRSNKALITQDCALSQFVEDMDDLMDNLGCEKAKLGGISMGAYATLHNQQMNRFRRISRCFIIDHSPKAVNSNGWSYGMNPVLTDLSRQLVSYFESEKLDDPKMPFKELPTAFQELYLKVVRAIVVYCFPRPYQKWIAQFTSRTQFFLNEFPLRCSWHAATKCLGSYIHQNYDMRDGLKEISIPVTIMMGMKSEVFHNEGVLYLDEHIPQSKLIKFKRSGHALFLTEPVKFRRELKRFLKD